jgi:ketosteroid isomerase-like protein
MTKDEMDRLMDEHFAYEAANDVDGVLSTMADDAEHDPIGFPSGPQRGKPAIRALYEIVFANLKQESYQQLHRYYGDNSLIDEVLYTGTINGQLVGLEGKEGRATWRMLHVMEFRDGKIIRENLWQDYDAVRQQLMAA